VSYRGLITVDQGARWLKGISVCTSYSLDRKDKQFSVCLGLTASHCEASSDYWNMSFGFVRIRYNPVQNDQISTSNAMVGCKAFSVD
jgi:hypothetical protein